MYMYLTCKDSTNIDVKVTNNDNKYEDYLDKEDYKLMNLTKILKTEGIVTNASTLVVVVGMSLPSIVAYNISSWPPHS